MLCKVTHCAGRVSADTRPHQLRWGDREMGTAIISCVECSQVDGLIQKLVETPRKAPSLRAACTWLARSCSLPVQTVERGREHDGYRWWSPVRVALMKILIFCKCYIYYMIQSFFFAMFVFLFVCLFLFVCFLGWKPAPCPIEKACHYYIHTSTHTQHTT